MTAPAHITNADASTNAVLCIGYEHHEIHAGSHYAVVGFANLATADDDLEFGLTTADTTKWIHLTFEVAGTGETELYMYEAPTYTGGGAVTPRNNNRNYADASTVTLVSEPTVTVDGTLILSASHGKDGANPAAADSAGFAKREREIILKQNTKYLFRIITRSDDNTVSYAAEWYEHTDKG